MANAKCQLPTGSFRVQKKAGAVVEASAGEAVSRLDCDFV